MGMVPLSKMSAMKIQSVTHNNRKRAFQVKMFKKLFQLPYSKVDPQPSVAVASGLCNATMAPAVLMASSRRASLAAPPSCAGLAWSRR